MTLLILGLVVGYLYAMNKEAVNKALKNMWEEFAE